MTDAKAPNRRGRPYALTPEVQKIILENVAAGATLKDSAEAAGITYTCLRESCLRPDFAEFAADLTRAKSSRLTLIAKSIANDPDWRARAWYLERIDREQWGKRETIEHEYAEAKSKPVEALEAEMRELLSVVKGQRDEAAE